MNPYDFYKLSEKERLALVGTHWEFEGREYFPCWLPDETFNYNVPQGLIMVLSLLDSGCLRICAKSPDDLDMELDIEGANRDAIIQFLASQTLIGSSYMEILSMVKAHMAPLPCYLYPDPEDKRPKKRAKHPR